MKYQELFKHCMLPQNFWDCKINQLPGQPYKKEIQDWVINFRKKHEQAKGLYLYGDYGRGKSGVASILVQAATAHKIPSLWLNYKELGRIVIDEKEHMFSADTTMLERARYVDFLIIDELQVRNNLHWLVHSVDDLIRFRCQNGLTTVITSNHSPIDLSENSISKSLASILSECVKSLLIHGKNFRA